MISGKTNDLIKNSSLIITRNSSAVAFACYYKKPIILFYTNETKNTLAQKSADSLSKSLGLKAVNLNNYQKFNFNKITKFEKKKYEIYLNKYCTFKNLNIPNYKIWDKTIF